MAAMTKCITATAIPAVYHAYYVITAWISLEDALLSSKLAADLRQFSKQEITWLLPTYKKSPLWSMY